jgi:hypothetical protein
LRVLRGLQTRAAAERIAAATVLTGVAQPAVSRESLAAAMVGDRHPIAQLLAAARAAAAASTPALERAWAVDRLEQFHADGNRLSDVDGARMLVALETISIRDALSEDMSRQNSTSHMAIWTELTRRGPDEVRAAPASMLGFASWLHGDGASAWCALDQVPAAALDIATGQVTAALKPRHRHQEFLAFLKQVERSYRDVADDQGVPASWMNLVEVWFGIVERQAIRRRVFTSVKDLNAKIRACIDGWNDRSHPFVWTKTADDILQKANRPTLRIHAARQRAGPLSSGHRRIPADRTPRQAGGTWRGVLNKEWPRDLAGSL